MAIVRTAARLSSSSSSSSSSQASCSSSTCSTPSSSTSSNGTNLSIRRRALCRRVFLQSTTTSTQECARRRLELSRLRALLPATTAKRLSASGRRPVVLSPKQQELDTVLQAVEYIRQLEATVKARMRQGTLPNDSLTKAAALLQLKQHQPTTHCV